MNTIIFHVRTHNDALYKSKINPVSLYFKKVNFNEFNPLEWMINETHRRGIDFHAWINPYRIKSKSQKSEIDITLDDIISYYKDYNNPANDRGCILFGKEFIILNPGLEKVRNFIANTIIEFLEKFDVDAIHLDDYFYCDMGAYGKTEGTNTILNEPDQKAYEEYINKNPYCGYDKMNAIDKAKWRREQVNLLIVLLKENIDKYNKEKNKKVQFGISPIGIYKNGDGKVTYDKEGNPITTGSETNGYESFNSFSFSDTLKWINNGWINYIIPQSYRAIDHPESKYYNINSWWNSVIEYKKINLYSGIGLFKSELTGDVYGWKYNDNELYEQIVYSNNLKNIDGVSIYNFNTLRKWKDGQKTYSAKQVENGIIKAWKMIVPPAEIKSFEKIKLDKPKNLKINNKTISFNKVNGSKFYVIYRSKEKILFKSEEIVEIFGANNDVVIWNDKDKEEGKFYYGVKALSYTNTLGEGATV